MKTHNDDKPFKCNNCNKEFRRKEELKKHVYSCKKVVYSATLLSTVVLLESASRMRMAIGLKEKQELSKNAKDKVRPTRHSKKLMVTKIGNTLRNIRAVNFLLFWNL